VYGPALWVRVKPMPTELHPRTNRMKLEISTISYPGDTFIFKIMPQQQSTIQQEKMPQAFVYFNNKVT